MIKRTILFLSLIIVFSVCNRANAQMYDAPPSFPIAYINSIELLELVPGKAAATKAIEELNQKYKDELAIMQNDYNHKYTAFLSNQNTLAESIKLRRMQELYETEQAINRFMKIAQEDIESQEEQLIIPLKEKLNEAINQVGMEQGYVCIYDVANPAIAFVTPNAVDASPFIKAKLGIAPNRPRR